MLSHDVFHGGAPLVALLPAPADMEHPSPNHDPRPRSVRSIACVVLHASADEGDEDAAEAWLCRPSAIVSAHLHIRRDGTVVRLVDDVLRARHAGVSVWQGREGVNDFSLGWELANRNDGREPYTDAQYAALTRLAVHYVHQGIPLESFVSHAEVARPPGRKTDPAGFDWERFRRSVTFELERAERARGATLGGEPAT